MATVRGHGPKRGCFRGAIDGGTIWWVAPSYPQIVTSGIWRDLKRACKGIIVDKSEVDRRIEVRGGGSITVRSADNPDSLRGPGLDGLVLDEASRISGQVWREVLRPALSDKQGWCAMLTTPNGKNWIYKQFMKIVGGELPEWQAWQRPSGDNPLVSKAELESLLLEIGPRAYAQEHNAQFTDIEGAFFPSEYFEDHIWADWWPDAFDLSAIAVDPSIGSESRPGDYSAIVFAGLTGGLLWVDVSMARRPPMQLAADVIAMHGKYLPSLVAVEMNGFQSVLAPLFDLVCQRNNIPPLPLFPLKNHENKGVRIQRLDPHLANHKIRLRRSEGAELMLEQMQMFPEKSHHDDGPDALEMAIRTLSQIAASSEQEQGYEVAYG